MRPGGRRSRSGQRWVSGGFDKLFAHLPVWRAHGRVEAWRGTSVLRTVPAARSRRHGDRLSPSPPFGGGHWAAADGRSSSRSAPVSAAAGFRREQQRPNDQRSAQSPAHARQAYVVAARACRSRLAYGPAYVAIRRARHGIMVRPVGRIESRRGIAWPGSWLVGSLGRLVFDQCGASPIVQRSAPRRPGVARRVV